MNGNNEIALNKSTMKKAIQHYFDSVVFAPGQSPRVTEVTADTYKPTFLVSVTGPTDAVELEEGAA